jgi:ketosteroid isomerase-like protein
VDPIGRFGEYAAAFEVAFENDDWSAVEPYFSEDTVYEILGGPPFAGKWEGRKAVLEYLKASLDGFDRRFETRELELLEGPELRDGAVWIRWRGTYRAGDAPPFVMEGEETARFRGERIAHLEDRFESGAAEKLAAWMDANAAKLKPSPA